MDRVPTIYPRGMATHTDHIAAAEMAELTGQGLLEAREKMVADGYGMWDIKDAGDRIAHVQLMAELQSRYPDDSVLSEEASAAERHDATRLSAERVWIIDPVDGTREYGEGRDDWAVHVALVEDGQPTAAAVSLPGLGMVLGTLDPPTPPAPAQKRRLVVSRTRPAPEARMLADVLDAELVPMGSAGAKAMAVVLGHADVYVHSGGQFEWDSAAPVGVARAAGLWCSRTDGTPLMYNRIDTYLPDLLICHHEDAQRILDIIN